MTYAIHGGAAAAAAAMPPPSSKPDTSAFNRKIQALRTKSPDSREIRQLYDLLLAWNFDDLSDHEFSLLQDNVQDLNSHCPADLFPLQGRLAHRMGQRAVALGIKTALEYYSIALNLIPDDDAIHESASTLFLSWTLDEEIYLKSFQRLYERGESQPFFQRVLGLNISQCCYSNAQYQAVIHQLDIAIHPDHLVSEARKDLFAPVSQKIDDLSRAFTKPTQFATKRYREALQAYRAHFDEDCQAQFKAFFAILMQDALALLGSPPCAYDIRATGSTGRGEQGPYSDLELFILIENEEHREYFTHLAQLLDLQMVSIGETGGLHIDCSPHTDPALIGTPDTLARLQLSQEGKCEPTTPHKMMLHSSSLFASDGATVFTTFQQKISALLDQDDLRGKKAREIFQHNLALFKDVKPPAGQREFDLKKQFINPLRYLLEALALERGIDGISNSFQLLDQLTTDSIFSPKARDLIHTSLSALHKMRIRLHLSARQQKDEAPISFFTPTEIQLLERIYWLVLNPLYAHLEASNFELKAEKEDDDVPASAAASASYVVFSDLAEQALQLEPTPPVIQAFVKYNVEQKLPLEAPYLTLLHNPQLATCYLETLSQEGVDISSLAAIHALDGWHYGMVEGATFVERTFFSMATDTPTSVKVHCASWDEPRYLREDIDIFQANGDIQKQFSQSRHNVAAHGGLHFKQQPNAPMMEYAVHNLTSRLFGTITPSIELVRFERGDKVYPVLISKSLGETTFDVQSLNPASLTQMLLATILTKPGDGRSSNYVCDRDGALYCIDNDVSFLEPVVRQGGSGKKVQFGSVLFCQDGNPILHKPTLEAFLTLSPSVLLSSWVDDLIAQETRFAALFTPAEQARFLTSDPEKAFSPRLLLKEGMLSTLFLQFYHLQERLSALDCNVTRNQLLEMMITQGSGGEKVNVGSTVLRKYRSAPSRRLPDQRLNHILNTPDGLSMSSVEAHRTLLGRMPTAEEVQARGPYSLDKMKAEIVGFASSKHTGGTSIDVTDKGVTLSSSAFEGLSQEHQRYILKSLRGIVELPRYANPTSVALPHCKVLNPDDLTPFLSDKLRVLNLRHCAPLTNALLTRISKRCPNLEELYLSDSDVTTFTCRVRFGRTTELQFPALTTLHLSRCELTSFKVDAPQLTTFHVFRCDLPTYQMVAPQLSNLKYHPGLSIFGKLEWEQHFGLAVEDEPPLENAFPLIRQFASFKTVFDSGFTLLTIPQGLTFDHLSQLGRGKQVESYTSDAFLVAHGATPVARTYRVLVTDGMLTSTCSRNLEFSREQVGQLGARLPHTLEATALCISTWAARRIKLYKEFYYTYCEENITGVGMVVGSFDENSLMISRSNDPVGTIGVSAAREVS